MKKVTFLGPLGATFSHDAYNVLSKIYGTPKVTQSNYVQADSNGEVLKLIQEHGGFGAIAMETLAEGRVAEPLESFIKLLSSYSQTSECPFTVIGAIRLRISFCLMARKGMTQSDITKIIAHPKALGACKRSVAETSLKTIEVASNGQAALLITENDTYAACAALAPRSAAVKYGLKVLNHMFEDREAITTFFLIAPKSYQSQIGCENRMLVVYKIPHTPGALVRSLRVFEREGLNLIQIHSIHSGNRDYHFAIEIEAEKRKLKALSAAMSRFESCVDTHLSFGPFEVTRQ